MRDTQPDDPVALVDDGFAAPAPLRAWPGSDRTPPAVAPSPLASARPALHPDPRPALRPDPLVSASRIDLSGLTAAPPLHRPTVSGAGANPASKHVGGAMRPPPSTVALSDGTHISFGAVEEIPVLEFA